MTRVKTTACECTISGSSAVYPGPILPLANVTRTSFTPRHMPWPTQTAPRNRPQGSITPPSVVFSDCRVLLVINNRPLQRTAWAAFHTARKRLDKISRDLRTHEETDTPAYVSWLHGTFPQLVTTLRQLHEEVARKHHQVETVQYMAAMTGRSLKKLWKEYQDNLANPKEPEPEPEPEAEDDSARRSRRDAHTDADEGTPFDDFFNDLFGDGDPRGRHFSDTHKPEEPPSPSGDAREIYRRLVQHLHPDRGGEWTPARERLWHEVQQAWAARDADWLARLEINWESANDTLSPDSSLDRLRRAIAELQAAHRDIDRKLRDYRGAFSWRFTRSEKKRGQLHTRVEANLRGELTDLQRHLDYFNSTIAAWEAPTPRQRRSPRS